MEQNRDTPLLPFLLILSVWVLFAGHAGEDFNYSILASAAIPDDLQLKIVNSCNIAAPLPRIRAQPSKTSPNE